MTIVVLGGFGALRAFHDSDAGKGVGERGGFVLLFSTFSMKRKGTETVMDRAKFPYEFFSSPLRRACTMKLLLFY